MMITGADYTYLVNIGPENVELKFLEKIEKYWPSPLVDIFDRRSDYIELFFSKDSEMNQFHEENGFSVNTNGEGCFMLYARRFPLLQCDVKISNISSPDEIKGIDPYDSKLFLMNVWEYTLVLPELVEESVFAKTIHDYLMNAFLEAGSLTRVSQI